MLRVALLVISLLYLSAEWTTAQEPAGRMKITVVGKGQLPLRGATVELLTKDSTLYATQSADSLGTVVFNNLPAAIYLARTSNINYETSVVGPLDLLTRTAAAEIITLVPQPGVMEGVTVTARKSFFQILPDKTVINVEAGVTNAGATVLEVLEKSPGVTMDRNGNLSLKGRPAVQVMIDGKLTQLAGADLQNMLNGMNASQVEQIELMDNPPAKYDAAGNAGIINIITKKNKLAGFNGSINLAFGQGIYPKNSNSLLLNYRRGPVNLFLTYSFNANRNFTDLTALRRYYKDDGSVSRLLDQPYYTIGSGITHNLRTGIDYSLGAKTTLGLALTGTYLTRESDGNSTAVWQNPSGMTDSVINTVSENRTRFKQGGVNLNASHKFSANRSLTADVDLIGYNIKGTQYFENKLQSIMSMAERSQGDIPTHINIFSAKTDYSHQRPGLLWEAGWKTSMVETDNEAQYYSETNGNWAEDLGKSNHFQYTENIHALYSSLTRNTGKWDMQAGLRYEYTAYKASQLGNAVVKDSTFDRNYHSLFPTAFITYKADSVNSFTLRGGRRIDRPAFQKLNPFVFIINKYTYQQGNPYFLPQYTWNIELSHLYKDIVSTGLSYNYTSDYFSQVFLMDTATGTIIYTEGNIGKMTNLGLSVSAQVSPLPWWSLSGQAVANHKKISGVVWRRYSSSISQLSVNINNQFRFNKGWGAELSGFYITRSQNDLQEVLDPTGQLAAGVTKQVLQNKATVRFTVRDIFYTQAMKGMTYFQESDEYFKITRDSRIFTLSFTWRFGKSFKTARRSDGAATEETNRVGTGN